MAVHSGAFALFHRPRAPGQRWRREQGPPRVASSRFVQFTQLIRGRAMDAATNVPTPVNEPVLTYAPGSPERSELTAKLTELVKEPAELTMTIGGERRMGGGARVDVVQPHNHAAVLGTLGTATGDDARAAVAAAKQAAPGWRAMPFDERAAVLLRAADQSGRAHV